MIKRVIGTIVFLLVANAGIRTALVYFHNEQFKDAVKEIALFGVGRSDEILRNKVMEAANDNQIPLDPDFIEIQRKTIVGAGDHVVIKYAYAVMVPVIPSKPHRFEFDYITP
ncbi:MAG TPA: hypothetical protein VEL79_01765 [Vicinamibacterales bacterium]|nr:hypothetical protein [Vicinamibacterales bacterium]